MVEWDEDQWQKIKSTLSYVTELFKLIMGCMLSVFVPQRCVQRPDQICTLEDNVTDLIPYNVFSLSYNGISLIFFILFYTIEFMREKWCITYLDQDSSQSNQQLKNEIVNYPDYFESLLWYNRIYYRMACITLLFAFTNIAFSSYLILYYYYLDYRSITNIITNSLLLIEKLYASYHISKSSKEDLCAISAYLVLPVVYNTIDEDFRRDHTKEKIFRVFLPSSILQRLLSAKDLASPRRSGKTVSFRNPLS